MEPHETYLEASLIHSDPDSAMRLAVAETVRKMVEVELQVLVMNGTLNNIVSIAIRNDEWAIKQMALRAIKEHFQNPQQIY